MTHTVEVQQIPIAEITVLNPRVRNKKIFNELVTSIAHLGLKKPITVSVRPDPPGYNLVCGQGRLEAFVALGQTEIPAIVLDASQEDCFVMSLVENLARRHHSALELVREIGALRDRGHSTTDIAAKTDRSSEYVNSVCYLLDHGEERLLSCIERGIVPVSIAIEIARAKDGDTQQALVEAYERRALPGNQVFAIRRILELRRMIGKGMETGRRERVRKRVTADSLVRSYRKETDRQKLFIKKAAVSQTRMLFIVNALRTLLADENFTVLLRAEGLATLPRPLAERLGVMGR
jgi:ParB family transcriptional regulator, chromosome partitioning protein